MTGEVDEAGLLVVGLVVEFFVRFVVEFAVGLVVEFVVVEDSSLEELAVAVGVG